MKVWAGRDTWVCFKDRRAARVLKFDWHKKGPHRCPDCGAPLINMGDKLRVPKRRDDRGWKEYEESYLKWRRRMDEIDRNRGRIGHTNG